MKPCRHHRKRLAVLALGELDPSQAQALRAHLSQCAGCRHYLAEISRVTETLTTDAVAYRGDQPAIPGFHQRVLRALVHEDHGASSPDWRIWFNWRLGVGALGTALALMAAFLILTPRQLAVRKAQLGTRTPVAQGADLAPTLSNYRLVAWHSLDQFDDLLTRQANRRLPRAPAYTAGMMASAD